MNNSQRSMLELELIKLVERLYPPDRLSIAKKIHSYKIYKISEYPDGIRIILANIANDHLIELLDIARSKFASFIEPNS